MGRILVLAGPYDAGAVAVAVAVAARPSAGPVALVHPADLGGARWVHRVSGSGRAATDIDLADGRRFSDTDIAAVLVRSEDTTLPRFARSPPADRDYANAEFRALLVSWLHGLGSRVVNRVDGVGLAGPSWSPRRWLVEAGRAGVGVVATVSATSARLLPEWRGTPYDARRPASSGSPWPGPVGSSAVLAEGRFVGPAASAAEGMRAACLGLAAASGCRVLELHFGEGPEGPGVVGVSPVPAVGSDVEAEAVADILLATAGGRP